MRSNKVVVLIFCLFGFVLIASFSRFVMFAAAAPGAPITADSKQPDGKQAGRVQLVTDQSAGVVRIVIDGNEIVWIDSTGLYVRGDIAYKGTITDGLPLRQETPGAR